MVGIWGAQVAWPTAQRPNLTQNSGREGGNSPQGKDTRSRGIKSLALELTARTGRWIQGEKPSKATQAGLSGGQGGQERGVCQAREQEGGNGEMRKEW